MRASTFAPVRFDDHQLLDSGAGEKLERFGALVLRRPDPQALWARSRDEREWKKADLVFVRESDRGGRFEARRDAHPSARARAPQWAVRYRDATFLLRPTPFKHVGIFPEQAPNWELVHDVAARFGPGAPRLLNLFGYTGVASVLAAQRGYEVTHVDASKTSVTWTRENAQVSGLADDALRLVVDDATVYAKREARRGKRYHVVLLDPPHHGRGPKGETWQFEDDVAALIAAVREILEPRALVVLSTYAIGCSPLALANLLGDLGDGEVESGELVLAAASGPALPAGFCARWRRGLPS